MTNTTGELATQAVAVVVQKQVGEVTQALATEVDNGRELVNVALRWFAENGLAFLVNLLVAVLLLIVGAQAIRLFTNATHKALAKTGRVNALLHNFLCSVVNKAAWDTVAAQLLKKAGGGPTPPPPIPSANPTSGPAPASSPASKTPPPATGPSVF